MSNFLNVKIELDKTAEEFRKAHSERQELLRQWENTIEQMQKRDREMDQLAVVSIFPTSCDHWGSCVNYIVTFVHNIWNFLWILQCTQIYKSFNKCSTN